jgi:hypothetical protein
MRRNPLPRERLIEVAPELEVGQQLKAYLEVELARADRR